MTEDLAILHYSMRYSIERFEMSFWHLQSRKFCFLLSFSVALMLHLPTAAAVEVADFKVARSGSSVAIDDLRKASLNEGDVLIVAFASGAELEVSLRTVRQTHHGNLAISGYTSEDGYFVAVANKLGKLMGSIEVGGELFQLRTFKSQIIAEPYAQPAEVSYEADVVREKLIGSAASPDLTGQLVKPLSESTKTDNPAANDQLIGYPSYRVGASEFRIFFYYDRAFPNAEEAIDVAITHANDIFRGSGIQVQLSVAGSIPIDIDPALDIFEVRLQLARLEGPFTRGAVPTYADADWDAAWSYVLRERPEGDTSTVRGLGSLLFDYAAGSSGGVLQPYTADSTDTGVILAHEVGHNLGADHNGGFGLYPYSVAYVASGNFATVMRGPSPGAPTIEKFSSPDLVCNGIPCGVESAGRDGADNRRTLEHARRFLAPDSSDQFDPAGLWEQKLIKVIDDGTRVRQIRVNNRTNFELRLISANAVSASGEVVEITPTYSGSLIPPTLQGAIVYVSVRGGRIWDLSLLPEVFPYDTDKGWEYFIVYEVADTGERFEGTRFRFFEDDEALLDENPGSTFISPIEDEALVRAATTNGGKVIGNPSRHLKRTESTEFVFEPALGYRLDQVTGTCPGFKNGDTYIAEARLGDCWVDAMFVKRTGSDFVMSLLDHILGTFELDD